MNTFTYSEARQNLALLLDKAKTEGKVIIIRKDGSSFELKAIVENKSGLDVKGINLNINSEEIIDYIRESRSPRE
jgi:antitoxin Phd